MLSVAGFRAADLRRGAQDYALSSSNVKAALDGHPPTLPEGLALLRKAFRHGEAKLHGDGSVSAGGGQDD